MNKKIGLLVSLASFRAYAVSTESSGGMFEILLIMALIFAVSMFTYFCAKTLSYKQENNALNKKLMGRVQTSNTPDLASINPIVSLPKHASKDERFCSQFTEYIEQNYSEQSLDITLISGALAISERQLQRKVKAHFGQTTSEFIRVHRLNLGAKKLSEGQSVTITALDVGFSSQNYFSQCFKEHFGVSPTEYINNQTVPN
ncbi:hypothetical protein N474_14710 [Pseudoalteromonas luteoviolacea CPMOR-2]|uniref:helix-turn-helix domain-containing protein n=1 Tax=Pseudoalteromonas luteoviolacea TaxID=43657 RepID=UPI0007B0AFB3|nr:helix-turn-helix domain-containing protein [Pseudoalteromonas luteoviolacea]KZN55636.1 hypothetical protein N474_14710 [Pseudoalteromonas luteoviolacea CPMOR-2]